MSTSYEHSKPHHSHQNLTSFGRYYAKSQGRVSAPLARAAKDIVRYLTQRNPIVLNMNVGLPLLRATLVTTSEPSNHEPPRNTL